MSSYKKITIFITIMLLIAALLVVRFAHAHEVPDQVCDNGVHTHNPHCEEIIPSVTPNITPSVSPEPTEPEATPSAEPTVEPTTPPAGHGDGFSDGKSDGRSDGRSILPPCTSNTCGWK